MILINFKGTQIKGTSEVEKHEMWIPVIFINFWAWS